MPLAPIQPAEPPAWDPRFYGAPGTQVCYSFDGYGEYVSPDGGTRTIYSTTEPSTVTYCEFQVELQTALPDSGETWIYFDRSRFGGLKTHECSGKIDLWNFGQGGFHNLFWFHFTEDE